MCKWQPPRGHPCKANSLPEVLLHLSFVIYFRKYLLAKMSKWRPQRTQNFNRVTFTNIKTREKATTTLGHTMGHKPGPETPVSKGKLSRNLFYQANKNKSLITSQFQHLFTNIFLPSSQASRGPTSHYCSFFDKW